MAVLKEWFGKESIKNIPNNLKKEIRIIESVLEETKDIKNLVHENRIKKLIKIIEKQKDKSKFSLGIEKKFRELLKPYLEGKKDTKKTGVSLTQILFFNKILREFEEEEIWKELKKIWTKEIQILKEDKNLPKSKNKDTFENLISKQKEILELLKKINSLEYNETHIHIGQSADPDIHWEFLKKYWILAKKKNIPDDLNIIKEYEKNVKESTIKKSDFVKLKNIMNHFLSNNPKNKWSEAKAFLEFSKLLILEEKIAGSFTAFEQKANIFNVIDEIADRVAISKKQKINKDYVLGKLNSIANHCIEHNIKHIEIRGGNADKTGTASLIAYAKTIEKKYKNKIKIRFIIFGKDKPEEIMKMYNSLPKEDRRYIVALDLMRFADMDEIVKLAKKSSLPICIHAGEFYGKKDVGFKGLGALGRIEKSLKQLQRCVQIKTLRRIGHANILAQDIEEYVNKEQNTNSKNIQDEITKLKKLKNKIIEKIIKRKIIIEASPTSNVRILGIKYEKHPIKLFDKRKIKYAISTDDRVTFNTNLKKEYLRIFRAMKWQIKDLKRVNKISKEALLGG